ncbi:MAG: CBS domain-containing protein [Candidatus Aenigmarchaeota archaeon]|nr:CBS domain-containing protein [Candidatus Aenigmarchaeota archaeon]
MIKLEDLGISKAESVIHIANLAPSYAFEFESLSTVVKTILSSDHRRIPVVSKRQEIVGIVTYMDILDALLRGLSKNVKISEFMTREVVFCEPSESIDFVLKKMKISKRDGLPLIKKNKLLGMVSESDFVKILYEKYLGVAVGDIMSHKPFFITQNISILECMKTMVNTQYRRLPVVEKNEMIGIVTGKDILRYLDGSNYNPTVMHNKTESIMTPHVFFVHPHEDVSSAVKMMIENKISGLPVITEKNVLKGIVTECDITELL